MRGSPGLRVGRISCAGRGVSLCIVLAACPPQAAELARHGTLRAMSCPTRRARSSPRYTRRLSWTTIGVHRRRLPLLRPLRPLHPLHPLHPPCPPSLWILWTRRVRWQTPTRTLCGRRVYTLPRTVATLCPVFPWSLRSPHRFRWLCKLTSKRREMMRREKEVVNEMPQARNETAR